VSIRIGGVPFAVGAPLLHGLADDPAVRLELLPPSALIERLRDFRLDVALVSSIEAFRRPGYRVVPGLAIAADGAVRSVRAFRRPDRPIRRVAADAGSESSLVLLRILLHRVWDAPGALIERVAPTLEPDALPHDLVLLIGDCGLRAQAGTRAVHDLGDEWRRLTGLPFVFALWLLAPGADAQAIVPRLERARAAAAAARVDDGTGGAVRYALGARERAGLQRFRDEAVAIGLADPAITPTFLPEDRT
jgi:chorismate dehydratase